MMKTIVKISISAFVISVVSVIFILASDFGCTQGNVGSAGLTGETGKRGDKGNKGVLSFSQGNDLVSRRLDIGFTQSQFPASLLLDEKRNFAISSWTFSVVPSVGNVTIEFQLYNKTVPIPFPGDFNLFIIYEGLKNLTRNEISVSLYFWRVDELNIAIVAPNQSEPIIVSPGIFEVADIAFNLRVINNNTAFNRCNNVIVYDECATLETFCIPST
jgi:hypothetical protein